MRVCMCDFHERLYTAVPLQAAYLIYFLHIHASQMCKSTNSSQLELTLEHGFVGRPRVMPLQLRQEPEHRAVYFAWLVAHQERLFACRKQRYVFFTSDKFKHRKVIVEFR